MTATKRAPGFAPALVLAVHLVGSSACIASPSESQKQRVGQTELGESEPEQDGAPASAEQEIEELCAHMVEMLRARFRATGDATPMLERCVVKAHERKAQDGDAAFAELSSCVLAAEDVSTLQACEF